MEYQWDIAETFMGFYFVQWLRGNCLELSPDLLLTGDGEPVGAMN
jgi:hypothetical protein